MQDNNTWPAPPGRSRRKTVLRVADKQGFPAYVMGCVREDGKGDAATTGRRVRRAARDASGVAGKKVAESTLIGEERPAGDKGLRDEVKTFRQG